MQESISNGQSHQKELCKTGPSIDNPICGRCHVHFNVFLQYTPMSYKWHLLCFRTKFVNSLISVMLTTFPAHFIHCDMFTIITFVTVYITKLFALSFLYSSFTSSVSDPNILLCDLCSLPLQRVMDQIYFTKCKKTMFILCSISTPYAHLHRILVQELHVSNLGPETDDPNRGFSLFSSVSQGECRYSRHP
jgi:hypothetical protein